MLRTLRIWLVITAALGTLASPGTAQLTLSPEFEPTDEEQSLLLLLTEQLLSWESTPDYSAARVFRFGDERYVVLGDAASDQWTPAPGRTPWSIQLVGLGVPEHDPYLLGMTEGDKRIDELLVDDFDDDGDLDLFACVPMAGMLYVHTASFDRSEWVKLGQTTVQTPGCRLAF